MIVDQLLAVLVRLLGRVPSARQAAVRREIDRVRGVAEARGADPAARADVAATLHRLDLDGRKSASPSGSGNA